jgi:hypothetical protein
VCRAEDAERRGRGDDRYPAAGGRVAEYVAPGWYAGLGGCGEGAAGRAVVCDGGLDVGYGVEGGEEG